MQSYYWIKLYHEILHDPKMGRLSDRLWRRVIEMFLLAGEMDSDGFLPDVVDMAWTLRTDEAVLQAELEQLANVGILEIREGRWFVTHFLERQMAVDVKERVARHRDRKRKQQYYGDETGKQQAGNETVTTNESGCNDVVTSRYTDKDTDKSRLETDAEVAADAARPPGRTFQDWHTEIQAAKNRQAVLVTMFKALYPTHDPPDFGRMGTTAKRVGGAGRLAELLWQHSTKPPTGNVLDYIEASVKNGKNGGNGLGQDQQISDGGFTSPETRARLDRLRREREAEFASGPG